MSFNRQIVLASRPQGEASLDNFRLVEQALPELAEGQVLVRNHFLSLDPYMRGRMNDGKSYAAPQALDAVMLGGTAGEVIASRNCAGVTLNSVWSVVSRMTGNAPASFTISG